jgi:methionine-rich copper-binding protein CopC
MENIKISSVSFNDSNDSLLVNCTLLKGSEESTICSLKGLTIKNYNGTVVASGTATPATLNLNQPTIVKISLAKPLPPEIYTVEVITSNRFTFTTSLNVGNFTNPQQKIEIRNLRYDSPQKSIFLTCSKIEERTKLFVYVLDSRGYLVDTDWHPIRTQMASNNETSIKVALRDQLGTGQYSLTISTEKGVTTHFTIT